MTETVDYHGWQHFKPLDVAPGGGEASSIERVRLLVGRWAMRGLYHPAGDCQERPRPLECIGAVRFNARGPHRGKIVAAMRGEVVSFSIRAGFANIFESDTYALDPTIGSSSPSACLAPLTPYLGLSDVTTPLMDVTVDTTRARITTLRPGQSLVLIARPSPSVPSRAVASCNGRDHCIGRTKQVLRLTIERIR